MSFSPTFALTFVTASAFFLSGWDVDVKMLWSSHHMAFVRRTFFSENKKCFNIMLNVSFLCDNLFLWHVVIQSTNVPSSSFVNTRLAPTIFFLNFWLSRKIIVVWGTSNCFEAIFFDVTFLTAWTAFLSSSSVTFWYTYPLPFQLLEFLKSIKK